MSRTSKVNGSAYGYSSSRVGSMSGARRPSFASTLRYRRYTNSSQQQRPETPSSFAQRLLL
ncbi:10922_t:CDS:1, partial [Acaulospora colombiana]